MAIYNLIEISGKVLQPTFSIYLIQIEKESDFWFYIGMTGDNHYQSARSAFHRLAGHFELRESSKQNQAWKYLIDKIKVDVKELDKYNIKMYHFPISGFDSKEDKSTYKLKRKEVLNFENRLIHYFKGRLKEKLLNGTNGKQSVVALKTDYQSIYNEIQKIIFPNSNSEVI